MIIEQYTTGPIQVNTYLAYDKDSRKGFIVDPGGYSRALEEKIKGEGITVEYIILTHGHGDHIGGVEAFLRLCPGAKLAASRQEKELLADAAMNFSMETCGSAVELAPDLALEDGDTLEIGGMKLSFILTPGHTKGGICILAGNVLFSGDTLFRQSVGRTDFPGGSFEELYRSITEKLFLLPDDTRVLPGHMGPTTIGYEKRNNPFV